MTKPDAEKEEFIIDEERRDFYRKQFLSHHPEKDAAIRRKLKAERRVTRTVRPHGLRLLGEEE